MVNTRGLSIQRLAVVTCESICDPKDLRWIQTSILKRPLSNMNATPRSIMQAWNELYAVHDHLSGDFPIGVVRSIGSRSNWKLHMYSVGNNNHRQRLLNNWHNAALYPDHHSVNPTCPATRCRSLAPCRHTSDTGSTGKLLLHTPDHAFITFSYPKLLNHTPSPKKGV